MVHRKIEEPQVEVQILFNSPNYYVAEIVGKANGFEIVNKLTGMGGFIAGEVATNMRDSFRSLVEEHDGPVTAEEVDDFLGGYEWALLQRVVYH